ncbi:myb/SANT-like DNA-binding domain-containing protein 4 [Mercenaria mercenaria]|uniref:myb/SANT-like DNA-binding domain-containing protein 4 n=1 Tax=Mercenaria mercenaria TaxID=6596 RepID=UPI00234F35F5|nr:myb/SANT-like DNA-binding domain-containing protein 4 [Mercenaria mercenaria]
MMAEQQKKKRRANFSIEELNVLTEEVSCNKRILFEKFSDTVTNEKKGKCWREIVVKVNAVSCTERTMDEIRKKWSDWSSSVKVKASKFKTACNKTGGGKLESPKLTELEEKVISIIGPTAVDGIVGGVDTVRSISPPIIQVPDEPETSQTPNLNCYETLDIEYVPAQTANPETVPFKQRKIASTTPCEDNGEKEIIKIEQQKLELKRERLQIEQFRLSTEQRRLEVEEKILKILEGHVHTNTPNDSTAFPYFSL